MPDPVDAQMMDRPGTVRRDVITRPLPFLILAITSGDAASQDQPPREIPPKPACPSCRIELDAPHLSFGRENGLERQPSDILWTADGRVFLLNAGSAGLPVGCSVLEGRSWVSWAEREADRVSIAARSTARRLAIESTSSIASIGGSR